MEKLANETKYQIFEQLLKSDLKSLRLVSKTTLPVATKLLFHQAFASVHLKDLKILESMSNHPTISKAVTEIIYFGVYFHATTEIPLQMNHPYWRSQASHVESEAERDYYNAQVEENKATLKDKTDEAILYSALAKMPNIRTIILTNNVSYLSQTPQGVKFGPPFMWDYSPTARKPDGRPLRLEHPNNLEYDHGFYTMCRAISIAGLAVQTFLVDYNGWYEPELGGLVAGTFSFSGLDKKTLSAAFRHVRTISLKIQNPRNDTDREIFNMGGVGEALGMATELEELTLSFTSSSFVDLQLSPLPLDTPLSMLVGTKTLPRLRHIVIRSKALKKADILGLLYLHRETLKSLTLCQIWLDDGTWKSLIKEARQWLRLESANLFHLFERRDPGWRINDYEKLQKYMFSDE